MVVLVSYISIRVFTRRGKERKTENKYGSANSLAYKEVERDDLQARCKQGY